MDKQPQAPYPPTEAPPPYPGTGHYPAQVHPGAAPYNLGPQPNYNPAAHPDLYSAGYDQSGPARGARPATAVDTTITRVVLVAGCRCPICAIGSITEDYTVAGIILAVLCFPWGLICCMLMKERKCSHCGYRA